MTISILSYVSYNAAMKSSLKLENSISTLFVVALAMAFTTSVFAASKMSDASDVLNAPPDFSDLCSTDLSNVHFYGLNLTPDNHELKMFVWNTKKFENLNAFADLKTHAETSDVVFIQEAAHSRDLQSAMIENLPTHRHAFFPSFCDDYNYVYGVQISTKLNSADEVRWPSPDTEPFSTIRKMSAYSLVEWNGIKIHLINTHALNFNPGGKFKEQIYDLYLKIRQLEGPVIWAGDFNTWVPMRRKYLFSLADDLGLAHVLPENDTRKLKLDHVFYRGLKLKSAQIIPLKTSDHFAISLEFTKPEPPSEKLAQY